MRQSEIHLELIFIECVFPDRGMPQQPFGQTYPQAGQPQDEAL
jgi:hypothetical protein